jgi:hypothetical protein
MKIAKPNDFRTIPFPDKYVTIDINISYSKTDKNNIIKGLIPEVMEDKWFVFYDRGVLNFHRSWTGYCIYRIYCSDDNDNFVLTHADVNRNQRQYSETDDNIDRAMIPYLINILLLNKSDISPYNKSDKEDILKTWSSVGKAIFSVRPDEDSSTDFIRIIPAQRFFGLPALFYRPYAFYADAKSLIGRTIAESYSLVKGLRSPSKEPILSYCTPFISWDYTNGDYDSPIKDIKVKGKKDILFEELPFKKLEKTKFIVLRVSRFDAINDLDVFPATWSALSFIVSDPNRMGARQPGWDMSLAEYASARLHALFKEVQGGDKNSLLALTNSKESLGLNDLDRVREMDGEGKFYAYLSKNSVFTNQIVELFGMSNRCWHGCGYLGTHEDPICRFFLLRNKMIPSIKVSLMRGKDLLSDF